jgi:rhodanese-related sulfurtransferase
MDNKLCTTKELAEFLQSKDGVTIIDVRSLEEYQTAHIEGSRCIPLPQLGPRVAELDPNSPILLVCKSGKRSQMAYDQLSKLGFSHLTILQGGIDAWEKDGLPLIKGKAKMSLERQVRIIAGSLMLLGLILKPLWWLSWFVGAMLIFAGITNTCMMMKLLMLLPYNRNLVPGSTIQQASCCE